MALASHISLLRMIAGTVKPDRGLITSNGTISWPIGFAGSFHKDLTGLQNAKFVARVYGVETTKLLEFVEDFAELGAHFNLPVRTYSSGIESRLAFGISMAIQFDTYLIDEVTAVGDAAFKKKCNNVLEERLKDSGAIVVSHSMRLLRSSAQWVQFWKTANFHYAHLLMMQFNYTKKNWVSNITTLIQLNRNQIV